MKKIALLCVLVSFLCCYLEWGADQSMFIFQAVYTIFVQKEDLQNTITHPAILLPLAGLLVLLYQAFQKEPSKRWVIIGMILPGLLVLLLLFIGITGKNLRIFAATLPFLAASAWVFWLFRKGGEA